MTVAETLGEDQNAPTAKFPDEGFHEKYTEWQQTLHRLKTAQRTWKAQDKSNVVADLAGRGADKPLFINFRYEDWVLLNLRVELHLLMFALLNDTTACTRIDRLSFFYNKYFKKPLIPSNYGFQAYGELLDIIKDAVAITRARRVFLRHNSKKTRTSASS